MPLTVIITIFILIITGIIIYVKNTREIGPQGLTIKVLFIGNSFTSVNDLPKMLSNIATSLGDKVEYDIYAPGGYTLYQDTSDQIVLNKIKSKKWDFVVLQEQSELPAVEDTNVAKEVTPYAIGLNNFIHQSATSTKTVFFETWGYKDGDEQYCVKNPTLCSYTQMQNQLLKSYNLFAQKTDSILAPVGEAWRLAINTHPEIELYQSDGKHPSVDGTYLSATVFYIKLFNKSVIGATSIGQNSAQAKILQQIATDAISNQNN